MPSNENTSLPEELRNLIEAGLENNLPREEYQRRSKDLTAKISAFMQGGQDAEVPASQPPVDPYAPTSWGLPTEEDFRCPSGQLCRVRRVDIMDLLGGGLLNSLDFVTRIVRDEHIPKAAVGPKAAESAKKSAMKALADGGPEQMGEFKKAIDSVVLRVVAKPTLWAVPDEGEPRVDGCVYVDSVAFTDKVQIFNWAVSGGRNAQDIEQFRPDADEPVGAVEHVEVVPTEAVGPLRSVESD
jgi:hypothetical protein